MSNFLDQMLTWIEKRQLKPTQDNYGEKYDLLTADMLEETLNVAQQVV